MRKDHVVVPGLVAFLAGAAVLGTLAAPKVKALPPPPPTKDAQVARALEEARVNLEAARGLGCGPPRVLLRTDELELALRSSGALREDASELVRLLLAARLVKDVARALAEGDGAHRLEEERLTDEDFRFVLAALEARLARALGVEPRSRPADLDAARLRQFRAVGFEDGLRLLFE
jgi:hypothetical protein